MNIKITQIHYKMCSKTIKPLLYSDDKNKVVVYTIKNPQITKKITILPVSLLNKMVAPTTLSNALGKKIIQ